ncbi:MAG: L-malyl-CoA/beta-methylmalyl-CoA lyase, partial [uncultured Acidimicrobiales bacterium]
GTGPPPPPLRPLHARRQRAGPREGEGDPRRRPHLRPRGRRLPGCQARGPRPGVRSRLGRRLRPPGGRHPRQRPRHRVGSRRPGRRRHLRRGSRAGPQDRRPCRHRRDRAPPRRCRRPGRRPHLGDARDPGRHLRRPGDRSGVRPAGRPRDGHERHRQGAPRRARAGSPAHALRAPAVPAGGPPRRQGDPRRRLQRHQGRGGLRGGVRPGSPARLRRQDPDPPHTGGAVQPRVRPEPDGGRAGEGDHRGVPGGAGCRQGRGERERPDDREPPRRERPQGAGARRGDRCPPAGL